MNINAFILKPNLLFHVLLILLFASNSSNVASSKVIVAGYVADSKMTLEKVCSENRAL